jgi:peptide deformylase
MAIKKTLQIGNPVLKNKNQKIQDINSSEVTKLIENLKDTMYDSQLIGIAAPQIGSNKRLFITETRETKYRPPDQADKLRIYINPKIVETSQKKIIIYEGCGSVLSGQLLGPVSRPRWIKIRATNLKGKKFEFKADGILGRVIQHEYDHLLGIEFTEKIDDYKKLMSRKHYIERIKTAPWHLKNSKITIKKCMKV